MKLMRVAVAGIVDDITVIVSVGVVMVCLLTAWDGFDLCSKHIWTVCT